VAEDAAPIIGDGEAHGGGVVGDGYAAGSSTAGVLEQLVQDVREAGIKEVPRLFQELWIDADAESVVVYRL